MNKMFVIFRREYRDIVKKKSFVIGTILSPLIMLAIIYLPALLVTRETTNPIEFTLVDMNSGLWEKYADAFGGTFPDGRPRYIVEYLIADSSGLEELKRSLNQRIENGTLAFYLVVPPDVISKGQVERYARNMGRFADIEMVNRVFSKMVIQERLAAFNVPPEQADHLARDVYISFNQVGAEISRKSEKQFFMQYLTSLAFVLLIFGAVIGYGQHLLRAVLEEKTTRIVEVLVSSCSPFEIMMGKIFGLGAASITQLAAWAVIGIGLVMLGSSSTFFAGIIASARTLSYGFFLSFAIFFILGYFFYAALFALFGSIVSSEKEAQQFIGPITMILMVPMILGMAIVQNPYAGWITLLSLIPLFTPTLMIMRCSLTPIPTVQIVLGALILLASTIILGWISARIFRVGILLYGKRPTPAELIKWIKYK